MMLEQKLHLSRQKGEEDFRRMVCVCVLGGLNKNLTVGHALPYAQHNELLSCKQNTCAHVGTCHEDIFSKVTADKLIQQQGSR